MLPEVREGGDKGEPIVAMLPESNAGKALIAISQQVAAQMSVISLQAS
jgi:ATP-binding protein involved in chromosome partitioning